MLLPQMGDSFSSYAIFRVGLHAVDVVLVKSGAAVGLFSVLSSEKYKNNNANG